MTSTGSIFTREELTWGAFLLGCPGVGQQEPEQWPGCRFLLMALASLAADTKEVWKTFALVSKCGQVRMFWWEIAENACKVTYAKQGTKLS